MSEFKKNPNYAEYLRPSPGPAKYALPQLIGCTDHDPRKRRQPCYTMGYRPQNLNCQVGPGPAKYNVENVYRYGRMRTPAYMGEKLKDRNSDVTPSPNAYSIPEIIGNNRTYMQRAPDYLMGAKLNNKVDNSTPGPGSYGVPTYIGPDSCKVMKPKAPVYTIGDRLNESKRDRYPGPAEYVPVTTDHQIPFTLTGKAGINYGNCIPGSNSYDVSRYKPGRKTPEYSMGIRYPDWQIPPISREDN